MRHSSDPTAATRLLREAQAAAKLSHPGIVQVFDFGRTDRNEPFIVMEMLTGSDLHELLKQPRPPTRRRGRAHRSAGGGRTGRGAQARHRSSRSEAGEHLPASHRVEATAAQSVGLWHRANDHSESTAPDSHRQCARKPTLPITGASARRRPSRYPGGRVGAERRAV